MSRFVGFIGPSYTHSSLNVDCQRCVNWYPEINELGTGKDREVASLVRTPGLKLLATLGLGPIRGSHVTDSGRFFVVSGNKVFELDENYDSTELGTLTTNAGPVSLADSGKRIAIVDGSTSGFFYNFAAATFTPIPFPTDINFIPFAGCTHVVFQDGYFVYNHIGTDQFFISGLLNSAVADESTIDPLDFKSSEGKPDAILAIISNRQDLWMFNQQSIEVFYNSGAAAFPFDKTPGAFIGKGVTASRSALVIDDAAFWLGHDKNGSGQVFMASGYVPRRISTHPLEKAIAKYTNHADAVAYSYQEEGHSFYVLNFPSANTSWAYDLSTGLWHERTYTSQGFQQRHRAITHSYVFETHVVGDYENGNIYEMSRKHKSDNGTEIIRSRISPHMSEGGRRLVYNYFRLDVETGVGLDGVGQGTDPKVMLRYSDDGGHTWSSERWESLGKIGEKKTEVKWNRLGSAKDRVWWIAISDPVDATLIGADIGFKVGA